MLNPTNLLTHYNRHVCFAKSFHCLITNTLVSSSYYGNLPFTIRDYYDEIRKHNQLLSILLTHYHL